jgi:beta-glucosidase
MGRKEIAVSAEKKRKDQKKRRPKKPHVVIFSILSVITVLFAVAFGIVIPKIASGFETIINVYTKTDPTTVTPERSDTDYQYYTPTYSDDERADKEAQVAEEVEAEGATLLRNDGNALPLAAGSKVSLFSRSSVDLLYGGTGSSSSDSSTFPTLKEALEREGISVNETLWDFYTSDDIASQYKRSVADVRTSSDNPTKALPEFGANEVPWATVEDGAGSSFAGYGDAAIYVISRSGGEGADLPDADESLGISYNSGVDGDYLELSQEEKDNLAGLKALKDQGVFKRIIVLFNTSNAPDCDFLFPDQCGVDYGIDAAVWIGLPGQGGIYGVADVLSGSVNPSGSLVDTYAMDAQSNPSTRNLYGQKYANADEVGLQYQEEGERDFYDVNNTYNVYQEGIYVGYRYYETRYEDAVMGTGNAGDYSWADEVAFPFGHGLSYTTFGYSDYQVTPDGSNFDVSVIVTNTGSVAGKKAVQVYAQTPYTDYDKANGVEKASATLVGFTKTKLLEPGESQTVMVTVDKADLASYDSNNAKTYILDAGDYYLTVADDAHAAVNNFLAQKGYTPESTAGKMTAAGDTSLVYTWTNPAFDDTTCSTSEAAGAQISNLFDEADPNKSSVSPSTVTWLSRSDWEGTYPIVQKGWAASDDLVNALKYTTYEKGSEDATMPTTGAKNGKQLIQMMGLAYDDPAWDDLLDQLTVDDMIKLVCCGFHQTNNVASVGLPMTREENGSTGLTASILGGSSAMTYTSEDVMAATMNRDLINEMGTLMGEDFLVNGYNGVYGPGVNVHRSPYGGRNFEYYSEDPYVAGEICATEISGIQSKGVMVFEKHVALNDAETYRMGISIWSNEQAIREIYLRCAEKGITEGGAQGIMSGFNRLGAEWCGESKALMTDFLRGECGMQGIAITDMSAFSKFMDTPDGLLAGTDLWDNMMFNKVRGPELKKYADDPAIVSAMREASHRILYSVVNSNAMNGIAPDAKVGSSMTWYYKIVYGVAAVFVLLSVLNIRRLVKGVKMKKAARLEAAPAASNDSSVDGPAKK